MLSFFKGSATAMITPFTAEGKVNFEAFGRMIEYQIENGTDALVVLGTTGEPATMTEEEKKDVMRFSKERAAGRARLIFGSGSNCTAHAAEASRKAQKLGADGLLVVTPYYNKCTQNGLYEYYKAVCEAVDIPVICYNVPPRTGVNIQPATMGRIAEIPNVAGIKEACGNMEQIMHTAREVRGKCELYSGDDHLNLPMLAIGAAGLISVVSNALPRQMKQLYEYMAAGEFEKAYILQDQLLPFTDLMFCEVNPIPVKAAADMLGLSGGVPRAPLTELEEAHKAAVRDSLRALGYRVD